MACSAPRYTKTPAAAARTRTKIVTAMGRELLGFHLGIAVKTEPQSSRQQACLQNQEQSFS